MSQPAAGKRVPNRFYCITSSENKDLRRVEVIVKSYFDENEIPELYFCLFEGFWIQTQVFPGDVLHIYDPLVDDKTVINCPIGKCKKTLLINNERGLLVVNPDLLLSTTTLMGASHCMRKVWLQTMFNIYGDVSLPLILGCSAHEIFQECLRRNIYTESDIRNLFNTQILKQMTFDLCALGMTVSQFLKEIEPYFGTISKWLLHYIKSSDAFPKEKKLFDVKRIHDIENEIWSTKYGVIGKIDITLEIQLPNDGSGEAKLVPLELKTGRHTFSAAHMGQVILYSYIIQDKYRQDKPNDGYLIYLKDDVKTELFKSNHNVFRDILILRNRYQMYHNKIIDLTSKIDNIQMRIPERIDTLRFCQNCEFLTECSLFYNCFESKNETHSTKNLFETALSHLSTSDLEFFSKNIKLLELEKQYAIYNQQLKQFWNKSSEDCEIDGNGLSKMEVVFQAENIIKFRRSKKARKMSPTLFALFRTPNNLPVNYSSFLQRRVMINEEILVSQVCFAIFGSYCKQTSCAVAFIEEFNDDFTEVTLRLEKNIITELNSNLIYRIDLLTTNSQRPMHTNFANIARLMSADDDRCRELRNIVIRGYFPSNNVNTSILSSLQKVYDSKIVENLNRFQKNAIIGVLRTRCSLIFGSPGSGKTQTIVSLIRVLHSLGFSVLVTSYTHVAVDNILMKLIDSNQKFDENVDFLRIGSTSRVHNSIKEYSEYEKTKKWLDSGDVDGLSTFYENISIVASTALGIAGHTIFQKRTFDYCILDEASQVVLATCLGPLFMAKNFVLVGDQKQLPPVIQNANAKKDGLEESLFSRLLGFVEMYSNEKIEKEDSIIEDVIIKKEKSPEKRKFISKPNSIRVFPLFIQYRMNRVIMSLANQLTYCGKLSCGNQSIEFGTLKEFSSKKCQFHVDFLEQALSPELEDSVIFLDIDKISDANENQCHIQTGDEKSQDKNSLFGAKKVNKIGYVYNDFEAKLIVRLVNEFLTVYGSGGLSASKIGVVSAFKKQVQRIKELIGDELISGGGLEVNTVDQYQGRDKEVIIYSCVKSTILMSSNVSEDSSQDSISTQLSGDNGDSINIFKSIVDSELLKDERRLNVAITRAKKKLIIVGNKATLMRYDPFKHLFGVMRPEMFVELHHSINNEASLL